MYSLQATQVLTEACSGPGLTRLLWCGAFERPGRNIRGVRTDWWLITEHIPAWCSGSNELVICSGWRWNMCTGVQREEAGVHRMWRVLLLLCLGGTQTYSSRPYCDSLLLAHSLHNRCFNMHAMLYNRLLSWATESAIHHAHQCSTCFEGV